MNPWQLALQIRHELRQVAWLVGSTHKVFGTQHDRVMVAHGRPAEDWVPPGYPWALVVTGSGAADEEDPDLIAQTFSVISAAEVSGDPYGHQTVVGGSAGELGKSAGRGVLEIGARVRSAVEKLTGVDGAKIILSAKTVGAVEAIGRGRHAAFDELTLEAMCTSQLHYAAPQQLVRTGSSPAVWTWQGAHCSDRFDFRRYTLGYKEGTTAADAAATIADLDVTLYQDTTASHSESGGPVSGKVYSVFAEYNARAGQSDTTATTTEGESDGSLVGAFKIEA